MRSDFTASPEYSPAGGSVHNIHHRADMQSHEAGSFIASRLVVSSRRSRGDEG